MDLEDGRAWITDWSTNGTWLNGERLPKSEIGLLADGDHIEPAHVVSLKAKLLAKQDAVHAVWLYRTDTLGGQLCYLLTDCQIPIPILLSRQSMPSLWLAWQRTPAHGPELFVCTDQGSRLEPVGFQQDCVIADRYRLRWQLFSTPVEQADNLSHLNGRL